MYCSLISEIYEHFLKIHILLASLSHLNDVLWRIGHEDLSCAFLANYVPKCQMSSGPYGPIFLPM